MNNHNTTNNSNTNRFLTLFSQPHPHPATSADEFDEHEVLWTPNLDIDLDRNESTHRYEAKSVKPQPHRFRRTDDSGVRAALESGSFENRLLCRKISLPSSNSKMKMIPAASKRQGAEGFMSAPAGAGFYVPTSVPVSIPAGERGRGGEVDELSGIDRSDKERLPPHEIVARGSGQSEMTFSVLEGVGRTLKGRDLRQVRNAILRQTGFLD